MGNEYDILGKEVAASVERLLHYQGRTEDLVKGLLSMTPSEQSSLVREIVIPFVKGMAKRFIDKQFDFEGRNAYACKLCNAMLQGLAIENPYIARLSDNPPLV